MRSLRILNCSVAFLIVSGLRAQGGGLPERFTLSRYVPHDVWIVVHSVENPQRAYIQEQWAEVWKVAEKARLERDLVLILYGDGDSERTASALQRLDKVHELVGGVAWRDLIAKETVFAERRSQTGIRYDYIFLARGTPGSGEKNFTGLVRLIEEGAPTLEAAIGVKFVQHLTTTAQLDVLAVGLDEGEGRKPSYGFFLLRQGDVIGAVAGQKSFKQVQELFMGKSDAQSILDAPRFKNAVAEVQAPTDSLMFFDVRAFMSDMCDMCERIIKVSAKDGESIKIRQEPNALRSLMEVANVLDYAVTSTSTNGFRESCHSVVRVQQGKQTTPLAKAFLAREPFDRFDRFIPADAVSYNVTGFVDVGRLYDIALEFISDELPGGDGYIAAFRRALDSIGLDPKRDIFSWLSGETVQIDLSAPGGGSVGGKEFVWFVRTDDPRLAWQKVNAGIDFVNEKLQARGQMLMVSPADVHGGGFRQITHPMLAMFIRPVIGVHGDWLVVGSSAKAVNRCLAVEAGKAPSIAENERFRREGVHPTGSVLSASFSDTSGLGEQLAQGVTMMGVFGGMVSAQMDESASQEAREMLPKLMALGMKLAPILKELDFYSSQSSVTTYDGATKIETSSVINYRPPPPAPNGPSR